MASYNAIEYELLLLVLSLRFSGTLFLPFFYISPDGSDHWHEGVTWEWGLEYLGVGLEYLGVGVGVKRSGEGWMYLGG